MSSGSTGVRLLVAAAVLLGFGSVHPVAAQDLPSPTCIPRETPAQAGQLSLVRETAVPGTRMSRLELESPALGGSTAAVVLKPPGYDASGRTRYPVLYLLHGAADDERAWMDKGHVQKVVDQVAAAQGLPPFLTVMPDGGKFGFYSDHYGAEPAVGATAPAWTTYHVGELLPFIDRTYPTLPDRQHRAIAGLSMGGFGAVSYAARFPHLFAVAGTFSGVVHPDWANPAGNNVLYAESTILGGRYTPCIWGDPYTQRVHWVDHDPTHLAANLSRTGLYVATGGGEQPGEAAGDPIEAQIFEMNKAFIAALRANGMEPRVKIHVGGTHSWAYWQQDLAAFLPIMVETFLTAPTGGTFDYESAKSEFTAWDWSFASERLSTEFTYLEDVSAQGLRVRGSGLLSVVTAPLYRPRQPYTVAGDEVVQQVVADRQGRLSFDVDLGPAHPVQQVLFDDTARETWTTRTVTIEDAGRKHRLQ